MWQWIKNIYHLKQAMLANLIYGFPARKLTTIGVTGTDGKTTTASLIYTILRDSGKKVMKVTTLGATINDKDFALGLHVTTPSSFAIQKFLRQALRENCTHAVIEVSSHALDQNRVFGIHFYVGLLTNISHEHLDYHKSMERYTRAKLRLLRKAKTVILNRDDASFEKISPLLPGKKIISYGIKNTADMTPSIFPFETQLFGSFNRYNCLAAAAAARVVGIDDASIRKSIADFRCPKGRQDIVYGKNFSVMIDFAVTPKAFESVLSEIAVNRQGRLIHVFGLSGKRDKEKRPTMGQLSSQYADIIVLTADDPRDEPIEKINEQIIRGIHGFTRMDASHYNPRPDERRLLFELPDREQAIDFAINLAQTNDFVLLTGKGHEKSLALKTGEIPWDEYKAVEDALAKRNSM